MNRTRIQSRDISRDIDVLHIRALIILGRMLLLRHSVDTSLQNRLPRDSLNNKPRNKVKIADIKNSSSNKLLPKNIPILLPRRNCLERRRSLSSNKPLHNCQIRIPCIPCQPHTPITPLHFRQGFNNIISVLRLLSSYHLLQIRPNIQNPSNPHSQSRILLGPKSLDLNP